MACFRQEVAHPLASGVPLVQRRQCHYSGQSISTSGPATSPWYSRTIGPMMVARGWMTTSVFTFTIVLDAILVDSRAAEDEGYGSDVVVKDLDRTIGECFGPNKKCGYIADSTGHITFVMQEARL